MAVKGNNPILKNRTNMQFHLLENTAAESDIFLQTSARIGSVASACTSTR